MKVNEFMELLKSHPGMELKFAYNNNKYVAANYHLTEVKNVTFDTTDCGGKANYWQETHMQLWENPSEAGKTKYMTTDKILSILNRVDSIKPLLRETELKFEYGNDRLNTGVMPVHSFRSSGSEFEVRLFEEAARCKANDVCAVEAV